MSSTNRTKGHTFERRIAAAFRARGWIEARRHLEPTQFEAQWCRDLDGTHPFAIQCKNTQSYPPLSTYLTLTPQHPDQIPLLIAAGRNGEPTLAVLALSDLMNLISPKSPGRPTPNDF